MLLVGLITGILLIVIGRRDGQGRTRQARPGLGRPHAAGHAGDRLLASSPQDRRRGRRGPRSQRSGGTFRDTSDKGRDRIGTYGAPPTARPRPSATPPRSATGHAATSPRRRPRLTVRAYRSDLRHFGAWCESDGRPGPSCGPGDGRGLHLGFLAAGGTKPATITRRLSAISQAHRTADRDSPAPYSPTHTQVVRAELPPASAENTRPPRARLERFLGPRSSGQRPGRPARRPSRPPRPRPAAGRLRRGNAPERARSAWMSGTWSRRRKRASASPSGGRRPTRRELDAKIGIVRGRHRLTDPVAALADLAGGSGGSRRGRSSARTISRQPRRDGAAQRPRPGRPHRQGCGGAGRDRPRHRQRPLAGGVVWRHRLPPQERPSGRSCGRPGHRSEAMVRRYIRAGSVFTEKREPISDGAVDRDPQEEGLLLA